jgi:hypothetical protein
MENKNIIIILVAVIIVLAAVLGVIFFEMGNESSNTAVEDNGENATTELVSQEQSSTAKHSSKYAPNGGIYPEYGPEVDSYGKTREYAIAHDMHYIELKIDGETVGGYTAIDPNTGTYHT